VTVIASSDYVAETLGAEMLSDASVSGRILRGTLDGVAGQPGFDPSRIDVIVFEMAADPASDLARLSAIADLPLAPQFIAVTLGTVSDETRRAYLDAGTQELLNLKAPERQAETAPTPEVAPLAKPQVESRTKPQGRAGVTEAFLAPAGDVTIMLRARGGAGASTVALNLAVATARKAEAGKTALIDLDLQNGAIALMLDLPDSAHATEFLKGNVEPDAQFLDAAMERHASGIDVLTAPDVFAPLTAMRPDMVIGLINALKARYDHVIIDMPQALVEWMSAAMEHASRVVVVSDMSLPSIKRTRRLIDLIAEEHMTLPIKIVMNFEKKPMFSSEAQKEAARLIGRPLMYWIPADPRAARRAMDLGKPLITQAKRSAASKSIAAMAKTLFARAGKGSTDV
jgi:Flp pilus assembly CpaE family ATPase